jgi:hypothetical protein
VTRLNLNKYPGYDPELIEDHTRVQLPAPAAADMALPPLISSVCEGKNTPFLYELPLAVLSRKFEHEVVPQRFGLLLSAELDAAILVRSAVNAHTVVIDMHIRFTMYDISEVRSAQHAYSSVCLYNVDVGQVA